LSRSRRRSRSRSRPHSTQPPSTRTALIFAVYNIPSDADQKQECSGADG
jgi:hypothetical protein